jgi:DNA-binding transcriptional LysR family regulator
MPDQHRQFLAAPPFVVAATIDKDGWPIATILAGPPGFTSSPDARTLRIAAQLDRDDPAAPWLKPGAPVGLLGIDFATRRRNRANGVIADGDCDLVIAVNESFGNCPQYIHIRDIEVTRAVPQALELMNRLDPSGCEAITAADMLFVATSGGAEGVDISHRGGKPGFVRVDQDTLTVPDFAGNRYFNTLGNMMLDPRAALLFPDFSRGDLLQVQGRTKVVGGTGERALGWRRATMAVERHPGLASTRGITVAWVAADAVTERCPNRKLVAFFTAVACDGSPAPRLCNADCASLEVNCSCMTRANAYRWPSVLWGALQSMDRIDAMKVFVATLDEGSLAAAGRKLGRSPAAVSRAVAFLEGHVGVPLLHRTTRSIRLSEIGERYAAACRRMLTDLEEADILAAGERSAPRGILTLTAPVTSGEEVLRAILDAFLDAYPTVSAKLYLLDRPVNLIDEGIDLALRISHLPDSSMVAVRVGEVRRIVVAAPSYLAKHPRIDEPGDLAKQQIIAMNNSGAGSWSFPPADGSTIPRTVQFSPRLLVNSVRAAVASAVEGRGVTRPLSYQVAEHVRDGRLQVVLRSTGA